MPQLNLCCKRWNISGDDLPLPAAMSGFWYFVAALLMWAVYRELMVLEDPSDWSIDSIDHSWSGFFAAALYTANFIVDTIIFCFGVRVKLLDDSSDWIIQPLVYIRLVLFFATVCTTCYWGYVVTFTDDPLFDVMFAISVVVAFIQLLVLFLLFALHGRGPCGCCCKCLCVNVCCKFCCFRCCRSNPFLRCHQDDNKNEALQISLIAKFLSSELSRYNNPIKDAQLTHSDLFVALPLLRRKQIIQKLKIEHTKQVKIADEVAKEFVSDESINNDDVEIQTKKATKYNEYWSSVSSSVPYNNNTKSEVDVLRDFGWGMQFALAAYGYLLHAYIDMGRIDCSHLRSCNICGCCIYNTTPNNDGTATVKRNTCAIKVSETNNERNNDNLPNNERNNDNLPNNERNNDNLPNNERNNDNLPNTERNNDNLPNKLNKLSLVDKLDISSIVEQTCLNKNDLICFNSAMENSFLQKHWYVCVDHRTKSIIIAIRGTLSLLDVLTDVCFIAPENRMTDKNKSLKYSENSSEHVNDNNRTRETFHALDKEGVLYDKSYELVITGHSLGAGVAALLALVLKNQYPSTRCIAYSPPGALLTQGIAEWTKTFITTLIVGKDIIPRLSLSSLESLRDNIVQVACETNASKTGLLLDILGCGCCLSRKCTGKDRKDLPNSFDSTNSFTDNKLDIETANVESKEVSNVDHSNMSTESMKIRRNRYSINVKADIKNYCKFQNGYASSPKTEMILNRYLASTRHFNMDSTREMCVPGRILHIATKHTFQDVEELEVKKDKSLEKNGNKLCCNRKSKLDDENIVKGYNGVRAEWVYDRLDFTEIMISSRPLRHHFPDSVALAVDYTLKEYNIK
eukprot:GSMAST32.ASY1.ANO1.161.1 assembled CDS